MISSVKIQPNEQEAQEEQEEQFELEFKNNSFSEYIETNPDFVGFVKIEDTSIDYPVVKGDDNDYYLKRDFGRKKDYYGSIFMDYRNFGQGFDFNTIIYGHNMKDNKMFGVLRNYMDVDFISSNPVITFQDLYQTRQYQIFSTYFADSDGKLITTSFKEGEYEAYLDMIQSNSIYDLDVDVDPESKILTLVTCSYDIDNGRYFIHAVEI